MVHAEPAAAAAAVARVVDLALAWESPSGLRPMSGVSDALRGNESAGVSGLRPMSPEPPDPEDVAARLEALSPAARALLAHVDDHGGEGTTGSARRTVSPADAATPVEELIAHRLLLPRDGGTQASARSTTRATAAAAAAGSACTIEISCSDVV